MKKFFKKYCFFIFVTLFLGLNFVYAEGGALEICSQPGTQRAMKLIGLLILIIKILIPIILIAVTIVELFKIVLSGKSEDFSKAVGTLIKKTIAALVIFFVPTLIHGVFNLLVGENTSSDIKICSDCIYDINQCQIDKK